MKNESIVEYTPSYSNTFTNMYLLPLKVVMYEILLGHEELSVLPNRR